MRKSQVTFAKEDDVFRISSLSDLQKKLDAEILSIPIATLSISAGFKTMALQNGYHTIADIVKEPVSNFSTRPGCGYRLLKEPLHVLQTHELTEFLEY